MKAILLLVLFSVFGIFLSFAGTPGYIDNRYYIDDLDLVVDEAVITVQDGKNGPIFTGTVCPGTGVLCLIPLSPDKDGDPVYLATLKRQGGPLIGN